MYQLLYRSGECWKGKEVGYGQGRFMNRFLFPAFVWAVVCVIFLHGSVPCFNECRVVPDFFVGEFPALVYAIHGFVFFFFFVWVRCWGWWSRLLWIVVASTLFRFMWSNIGKGNIVVGDERTRGHDDCKADDIQEIYVTSKSMTRKYTIDLCTL